MNETSQPDQFLLDPKRIKALYDQFSEGLQRFLLGVLKEPAAAEDALQNTFLRLAERGHQVQNQDSIKSWLYQVAFNEAMLVRRKQATGQRHQEKVAWHYQTRLPADQADSSNQVVQDLLRREQIEQIRQALEKLSPAQRIVVEKRIYEGKKFREIAEDLKIPLATVLARMQTSLKKLKPVLTNRLFYLDE